jgi:4-amino-4-deoxy-L-arabinose transferase-like glycosyltransferase
MGPYLDDKQGGQNTHKFKVCLLLALMFLSLLAFFCYQAWLNPKIEFLIPSFTGRWILHSPDMLFPDKLSGTVLFRRRFELDALPGRCDLTIRAATQFSITVNGRTIEADSQHPPHNWKFARTYDIAPFLATPQNSIEIHVANDNGLPALLVEASALQGSRLDLSSNTDWESAPEPDFSHWRHCVLTYQEPPALGADKTPVQNSNAYPIYATLFALYTLLILLAVIPWHVVFPSRTASGNLTTTQDTTTSGNLNFQTSPHSPEPFKYTFAIFIFLLILIILAVNIHNVVAYPYSRSHFDSEGHVAYVKYMAAHWRVPNVTQGWEMYQPPLYYFFSAIVYRLFGGEGNELASLKAVQILGMLSGLACILFSWFTLRVFAKNNRLIQLLGLSTVAFLPMSLYLNPTISNEVFSAFMISLAVYLLVRYGFQDSISYKQAVVLGAVVGLALLSKYTALLVFLVAVAILLVRPWIRAEQRRRELAILVVFIATVLATCGWFYYRNAVMFHKPFVANWDEESGFHFEQPPGYRTLGFYLRFGSIFAHAPERSRWSSFWDGYYGSMWMDPHFNMIDYRDDTANSLGSIVLCLALLPSVAMAVGFVNSLKRILLNRLFEPDFALAALGAVTMLALIWFTMQIPFITTIKAFFTLSLMPAFAVFSGIGLHAMAKNLRKFAPLLYAGLIMLFALITCLFWYRPS